MWREQVMRGIAGYSNEHGPWHIYTAPEGAEDSVFFSERYAWDGLIVRPTSARFIKRVLALGVPAVAIGSVRVPSEKLPRVRVDDDALTQTALKHLISGGLRRFAYCGFFPSKATEDRGTAFARAAAFAGYDCKFFTDFAKPAPGDSWPKRQRDLARWVKRLEKPVGILAWNPDVACQLVEACHVAGVVIPSDAAVVAADDDRVKCELTSPTISAVEIPAARIGYEAAALLEEWMNAKTARRNSAAAIQSILIQPSGVVTVRQSSDTASVADRDVHQAVQYIRDHCAGPLEVDEIARAVGVSRRWLERHFRRVLDCSPHEVVLRERTETAKRLLLETDWPAMKIARSAGFASASYLNHVISKETGLTPLKFRRRFRI
jgi:LacI family transcriptional regulator